MPSRVVSQHNRYELSPLNKDFAPNKPARHGKLVLGHTSRQFP